MTSEEQRINEPQTDAKSRVAVLNELIKLRLTGMVLITTLVGFYVGSPSPMKLGLMFHALLGTALVAGGAAALNQYIEREYDARMRRTEDRPIPSGRISPDIALIFGGLISAVGLAYLAFAVNLITSALGAITLGSYLFIYTPLKRVTPLNTIVGAVPGALPPLMGWTAVQGEITVPGWSLFAILFFWQLPHFMAIAWMYREDYANAGYKMLPVVDPTGLRTGGRTVSYTLGLLAISLFPFIFKLAGRIYLAGALVLGVLFLAAAIRFARRLDNPSARALFYASIIYLPLLLGLMAWDKVK